MEADYLLCEVQTEYLHVILINFGLRMVKTKFITTPVTSNNRTFLESQLVRSSSPDGT
jgi:hypothetical protein